MSTHDIPFRARILGIFAVDPDPAHPFEGAVEVRLLVCARDLRDLRARAVGQLTNFTMRDPDAPEPPVQENDP